MTKPNSPLVVDLDGTLTPTDTLVEAVIQLIRQSPANLALLVFQLFRGRAAFKQYVASRSSFSARTLPIREPLLTYLRAEKTKGRQLVLATASHESVAKQVASHVGIFDHAIGTQGKTNLKGENKLRAIRRTVGERFVYAGDGAADVPIWKAAEAALLVDFLNRERERFGGSSEDAQVYVSVGQAALRPGSGHAALRPGSGHAALRPRSGHAAPDGEAPDVEVAAWMSVCRAILNLNETITRY